ncbi:ATP-dependent nuclease [Candidatus Oscillochloris fontis]|uniref:ATP-dependent nuclease n=1 Tax=Candidatus Oscillochloris fontis TaxID=2496868 RepID=UPI00101DC024|nr:AAA family ATPase [Candidatus Oscillochloris fontis]
MRIHGVQIKNFRNFQHLDVKMGNHAVIVGENKVGKTNFLFALRLVLDSSLPDSVRQLQTTDFWDGLGDPVPRDASIHIIVDLIDFEYSHDLKATLSDCLIEKQPFIARLNYLFRCVQSGNESNEASPKYEFLLYGADDPSRQIGYRQRRWMPLDLLQALRDAENDLATFRRSPLQPLLNRAFANISAQELREITQSIHDTQNRLSQNKYIKKLDQQIAKRLSSMVGPIHNIDTSLRVASTRTEALLRAIRLHIDGGTRDIAQASLGSANLLYIALRTLEIQKALDEGERHHSFLAIEEPEAHLHPHVQRLAYRHFLRSRSMTPTEHDEPLHQNILMTTHSPHIVSIAPLRSFVLLRRNPRIGATEGVSTANTQWTEDEVADLERYLEVTRGEILFARGVVLVEGDAEEYIIPVLAKLLGYDFDEHGISVCSIAGTHFEPYIKLLGSSALNIPHVVLTDFDPVRSNSTEPRTALGPARVRRLLSILIPDGSVNDLTDENCIHEGQKYGIFINKHTLEVDLFRSGGHETICDTVIALSENGAARRRAEIWRNDPGNVDIERLLEDIKGISKGRFAQNLAQRLTVETCPDYIRSAITEIVRRCE